MIGSSIICTRYRRWAGSTLPIVNIDVEPLFRDIYIARLTVFDR